MATRRYRGRRSIAVLVAVAAIIIHVVVAVHVWRQPDASTIKAWAYISYAGLWVPLAAMGALIALRGARRPGTAMLALSTGLIALNNGLASLLETRPERPWPLLAAEIASALFAAGAYLRASQLFPRPMTTADLSLPAAPWQSWPLLRRALALLLRPWAAWVLALAWLVLSLLATTILASPLLAAANNLVVILCGAAFWYARFRIGTAIDRRRVVWLLQMVLVFAVMLVVATSLRAFIVSAGAGENARAAISVGYNLLVAVGGGGSLAMAVFSAGAVNPSLVVRSTVIYGATVSILLFALNVIVSVLVDSAVDAFGLDDRLVAASLGALAGLSLEPVAKLLRRLLDPLKPEA